MLTSRRVAPTSRKSGVMTVLASRKGGTPDACRELRRGGRKQRDGCLRLERSSWVPKFASYRGARTVGKNGRIMTRRSVRIVKKAERMGRVVALMAICSCQMKLAETAKQVGVEVKVARTVRH